MNILNSLTSKLRNLKLYDLYLELKHRKQRARRGWADNDLFSLDWWFQSTFIDMLNNFQIRTHGHPQETFEEIDTFEKGWIKEQLVNIKQEMISYKYNYFTEEDIDEMIQNMDDYIKWKLIIKRIIYYLNESNEDNCSRKNKYFELWYDNTFNEEGDTITEKESAQQALLLEKWTKQQDDINLYRQQCAEKAFQLLGKYFFNLWD